MSESIARRRFLQTSAIAAIPLLIDAPRLARLSQLAAADIAIANGGVQSDDETKRLVRLLRSTPREKCVEVFVGELKRGLSYQDFLSTLLLAALEHGDPHQVAQIYSAHRVASLSPAEVRLLPLFWALDRVRSGFDEEGQANKPPLALLDIQMEAAQDDELLTAMRTGNGDHAQRAIVTIARNRGPRHAMSLLWRFAPRRVGGSFGHTPIVVANGFRTLEAIGWQHAEPLLRYAAGYLARDVSDASYAPNVERTKRAAPKLAANWALNLPDRVATLSLYSQLRTGETGPSCDEVIAQLTSGRVHAGAAWDAIHLVAADLLVRYKTGGTPIGGMMVHAVTSTNALRFAFENTTDDAQRLVTLLQGVAALGDTFMSVAAKENELRDANLLELQPAGDQAPSTVADLFAQLPSKAHGYSQKSTKERDASDQACAQAIAVLQQPGTVQPFMQSAIGLLCQKASADPHDMKYPVAAFEDALQASPQWRPYLLAASLHALHGTNSEDTPALKQAKAALG